LTYISKLKKIQPYKKIVLYLLKIKKEDVLTDRKKENDCEDSKNVMADRRKWFGIKKEIFLKKSRRGI